MNRLIASLGVLVALASSGCMESLHVKRVDAAVERPANVLLFFRVTSAADDQPVTGLQEAAFSVKEDEHPVGAGVDRVIVNPDLRASEATLLLVDLGGRPAASELEAISAAVSLLAEKVGASRRTAIYAIDGAEQPAVLAPFGASSDALKAAAARITQYKTRDPSLDLNGGYIAALRALRQATPASSGPRIANLVLIARGADRASRATLLQVQDESKKADVDVSRFAVGFGADAALAKLGPYSESSLLLAASPEALRDAASRIAEAIDARGRSFYLLSYCTAARAGEHKLTLDVSRERVLKSGRTEVDHGSLLHVFRADGFGPGCTPSVPDGWRSDAVASPPAAHLSTK